MKQPYLSPLSEVIEEHLIDGICEVSVDDYTGSGGTYDPDSD